jgi:hypothetical protein
VCMHDMCDTREMCEARKSRSSRACRASSRDPCMRDVWGMPRPADLRACEASDSAGHCIRLRPWLATTDSKAHYLVLPYTNYRTSRDAVRSKDD